MHACMPLCYSITLLCMLAVLYNVVYSARRDVVKLEVLSVSNPIPSDSGVCHYINKTKIEVSTTLYMIPS